MSETNKTNSGLKYSSTPQNINDKANDILEAIMAYARLEFDAPKLEIGEDGDVFDAISSGVNMLGEELKENVVSNKEKEHLLKEIHHRVKNNMQIISSMLRLQFSKENDDRVVGLIQDSQSRIHAMALVHEMLYSTANFKQVQFDSYVRVLTKSIFASYASSNHKIVLNIDIDETLFFEIEKIIPLGLMVNEIVTNSLKYAFKGDVGEINIQATTVNNKCSLLIYDNGKGLSDGFDMEDDGSLGMQLIYLLAEQIGAEITQKNQGGLLYQISFETI